MKTEIISFYSDVDGTTYYSDCAKRLTKQLTDLSIPHDIREKKSLGTYQKNCLSKPLFILSMLEEKQKPIVWLDVDSDVRSSLDIFDRVAGADIVVAQTNLDLMSAKASPIYFANNKNVTSFLNNWIDITDRLAEMGKWFDHEALLTLLRTSKQNGSCSISFIGPEYCMWPGTENENTVILMGLSDTESKKSKLREHGFSEEQIQWQSPGIR